MRDVWKSGIEWYIYYTNNERKAKLALVIMDVKAHLDDIQTMGDLSRHYATSPDLISQSVKKLYPRDWWLDTHQAEDVAYGLRCIELATGKKVDLTKGTPSRWVVETVA
ncbi:MAG: hypothetical protein LC769_00780 [Chloroflexi bacterium]|nr:hypothetical protein [Chloroflexota bacterium]